MFDPDIIKINKEYNFDMEGNLCVNREIIITKENFESRRNSQK